MWTCRCVSPLQYDEVYVCMHVRFSFSACIVVMNELWNRGLYHALLQSCRVNHSPQLAIHLLKHMTERVCPTKYVRLLAVESSLSHHQSIDKVDYQFQSVLVASHNAI